MCKLSRKSGLFVRQFVPLSPVSSSKLGIPPISKGHFYVCIRKTSQLNEWTRGLIRFLKKSLVVISRDNSNFRVEMFFGWILVPFVAYSALQLFGRVEYPVSTEGIILITGASTGIGRHAAEHLANKYKSHIILAGVRKETDASSIRDSEIENLLPIIIDVTSHDSCVKAVGEILSLMEKKSLPFVGLVNNAGIGRTVPIEFHQIDDARKVFDTNFFGVLDLIQLTLPMLRASKGRIINISSIAGMIGTAQSGIYSASKFALEGFSDSLRREMAPFGVSVTVVQPAFVKTAIHASDATASSALVQNPEDFKEMKRLYGRFSTPEKEAAHIKELAEAEEPIVTSLAIDTALMATHPATRYAVARAAGMPAHFISWLDWIFTDRLQDIVIEVLQ